MSGGLNYIWRVQLAFPGWLPCGFGHKPIGIGLSLPQIGLGWLKTTFYIILRTLSPSQFIFSELPPPRQSFIFETWVGNFF
jgi:hypothetical protein